MIESAAMSYMRFALLTFLSASLLMATEYDNTPSIGPARGWLLIHGGGEISNEVKERFVALAGGPNASIIMIPTALDDSEVRQRTAVSFGQSFGVRNVTVLHTRDRIRSNSE